MGDRIPGEVAQDLGDAVGIRFERAPEGSDLILARAEQREIPAQVIQEIVHCNRATVERSAGVLARQAQHLTDQPFYSLQLTPNDVEAFAFLLVGVTPQQVELSLRDRDRCSRLVGSVSHELSLAVERPLQPIEHVVERYAQALDLGGTAPIVEAAIQLTSVDAGGELRDPIERPGCQGCDPNRGYEEQCQRDRPHNQESVLEAVLRSGHLRQRLGDVEGPDLSAAARHWLGQNANASVAPGGERLVPALAESTPLGPAPLSSTSPSSPSSDSPSSLSISSSVFVMTGPAGPRLNREDPRIRVVGLASDERPSSPCQLARRARLLGGRALELLEVSGQLVIDA